MARVRVSDEVWAEFRTAVGWQPLNTYLGAMVQREVERHRSRRLRAGQLNDREWVDAFERARELHEDLSAIVERLERRLDPAGTGASEVDRSSNSWADEIDFGRG